MTRYNWKPNLKDFEFAETTRDKWIEMVNRKRLKNLNNKKRESIYISKRTS